MEYRIFPRFIRSKEIDPKIARYVPPIHAKAKLLTKPGGKHEQAAAASAASATECDWTKSMSIECDVNLCFERGFDVVRFKSFEVLRPRNLCFLL